MDQISERLARLSPAQLAELMQRVREKGAAGAPAPSIPRRSGTGPSPLSFAQRRLWFIQQLDPENAAYNAVAATRLDGALDARALRRALAAVVERHEALRTVIVLVGGEPAQQVLADMRVELEVEEMTAVPEADREAEVERRTRREQGRPFDLAAGPLLRATLLRLAPERHVLLLAMHHVVSDGWSRGVIVREISEAYTAGVRGEEPRLPELPVQYPDYAAWQRERMRGDVLAGQLGYWTDRLAGAPEALELPTDRPRPPVQSFAGRTHRFRLPGGAAEALRVLGREEGATPFMVLLAAWKALLARYTGQTDLVVGTPVANRGRSETEGLVGFFANTLALRTDLGGEPTFREALRRVRATALGAYAHEELPFERLVEELHPGRDLSRSLVFQVMFLLDESPARPFRLPGLELAPVEVDTGTSMFDLTLGVDRSDGGLAARLEYSTALFDAPTIVRMAEHLCVLLGDAAARPDAPVWELALAGGAERALLEEWNATGRGYPAGPCVHELFAAQAARTPDAPALVFRGEALTYAALDAGANRLAGHLRGRGVGPETRVGVCLERTPELIVALLGVLKAGGAYVPLDPAYPRDRLGCMVEDAGIRLVLTTGALAGRLPGAAEPVRLDALRDRIASEPSEAPASGVLPGNLSHVIFTSGSTGRPKGVMVRHSSTAVLLHWMRDEVADAERASVLAATSASFDVSVAEIFGALCWGGKLVLVENALELSAAADQEIRYASMVPAAAAELLRTGGIPASVRTLNLAGEALPADLARALYALGTVDTVRNLYGPTEDTSYSTCSVVERGAERVLIGRPLAESRAHVLDGGLRRVPVGVPGELYLAGEGLARGYEARPDLTAETFLPDPFGPAGSRMYRTMDRVRWTGGGELEYLGRTDFQVKVRGFRIEPGEVEAALRAHPGVADAVCVAREDEPGERRLAAYLVPRGGVDAPAPAALRAHLRERLPEYMVPSAFVPLAAFPLTPTGKVDRRALPAPAAAEAEGREAPLTPAGELLAGIFAGVLGVERVGGRDDFFALGGHSLLATRVAARVREAFGVELPVRALFEAPTVAELAARVEALRRGAPDGAPPLAPAPRDRPLPLSFAQHRLWFIDRLEPGGAAYNVHFALRLRGRLDVGVLERSLAEVVRRHESLRTTFAAEGGDPVQVVHPAAAVHVPVEDLRRLPEGGRTEEARRRAAEEALRPFDLARGPLLRSTLLRLGEEEHALLFTAHHAVTDGWSMGVLVREVSALYEAFSRGAESPLHPLPLQYADYAAWQRAWLTGEALERQLAHWREALADAPPHLELPADRPRPRAPDGRGAAAPLALAAEPARALRALSRREGTTLFMTLLAAWQLLLSRYGGQEDVLVGTPVAGRGRVELEGLIGLFVNTLVLRADLSDGARRPFTGLLARVRDTSLAAYAHQEVPFEKLVEELQPERSPARSPFFQVMFSQREEARAALRLGDVEVEGPGADARSARFDLSLTVAAEGDGLGGSLVYRTDLFDGATVERMLAGYAALLEEVAADPSRPLAEYGLLPGAERRQVLEAWNATSAEFPAGETVHGLFAAQAARTPDALAVVFEDRALTYAELDSESSRLARHLRGLGVGPDSRVGVCLERGVELVVAVLAALKAGGAYVPLDPAHPAERLVLLLDDAGASAVVTAGAAAGRLSGYAGAVVRLDADAERIGRESAAAPAVAVSPENLAYLIYTSGSTGRPKGVMVEHRSVVNLWAALERAVYSRRGAAAPPRVSVNGPATFDTSVKQLVQLLGGAALCVVPEAARYDADALGAYLRAHAVEVLDCTPAQLRHLLADGLLAKAGPALTDLLVAGEAIDAELWRTLAGLEGRRAWNLYGPTECTVDAALRRVAGARPALGPPIANVRLYVLDAAGAPAPVGVPGELHVGGAGVARGYAGRPELTAERFVPDPFSGDRGARLYRTGDRVRWTAAGEVEYLGRADFQLKVRGFRVEPGEIEAALCAHPAVRRAVVVARADASGGKRLVGYVVAVPDAAADPSELRSHLRERLPDYMVPSAWVALEAVPLTPNGKVDHRALPEPAASGDAEAHEAPRTPAEAAVAGIFAAVLGVEGVGARDDFFALGGHSLVAARVASRVREALGVELPLRTLFEHPTVEGLAGALAALAREASGPPAPPVVPVPRDGALPLSFAQQRLWLVDQLAPGRAAYNLPYALRLRGSLDAAALERSLAEVVRRHETLRTRFPAVGGEPVQAIGPAGAFPLARVELRGLGEEARERALRELAAAEALVPFDLASGPLLRGTLVRLGGADHALLFTLHHIVSDGWSTGVLVREVSALYAAFSRGEASPLPALPVQYADYAVWQRARLRGEVLERQLAYWRERLGDAPPLLGIPTDRPRPGVQGEAGGRLDFALPEEATRALRALSRREGATLFMTLLAGWQLLLSRYSGEEDVSVGTPVAGRTRLELEGLIGFFVNTLVLRTDLSGGPAFRALLGRVREATLGAHQHQEVPFEKLVEELAPERSLGHTPLFQALLVLQNDAREALRLGSVEAEPMDVRGQAAKFDLALAAAEAGDRLVGTLTYRAELFDPATAGRMLEHLGVLLRAAAAEPDRPLGEIALLDDAERRRVVREWNATDDPFDQDLCVHQRVDVQARRTPGAVAVSHGARSLTYAELEARSNRLAHALRRRGVGPEACVGVCVERSPEMLVALLGVLKAGGAYVPLDPAHPAERLRWVLEDARVRVLLAGERLAAALPAEGIEVLRLDADRAAVERESGDTPVGGAGPENLAYVIYTSGSTGRPKGVQVEHRSVAALIHWLGRQVRPEEAASVLGSTAVTFDVSVAEIFGTLCRGGKLVLVENALELADVPAAEEVRLAYMVPGAAAELLRMGALPGSVRTLNLAGEALPAPLARALHEAGVERVVNIYGPTEATVYATCGEVGRGAERVSIGRPVPNTRAYVLDAGLGPVPAGVAGELFIGGVQVARGYLGRPELTAEKFVPDPFSGAPGLRLYRTGDRVRWSADGEIEYLGRIDFQVKVRGFRIELGEIEAALREQPGVGEVVVVAREDAPGERRLVAYLAAGGAAPDPSALRAGLRERLPEYMVPSAWVVLDALPVNSSGKVDRRTLPAPESDAGADAGAGPRTAAEEVVAGLFAAVLGVEAVGVHDDFFALGGHSLLAARLVSRAREALGVELPLRALFEAPTVEALAARTDRLLREGRTAQAPPLVPAPRSEAPPLSFAQQRLWFMAQLDPGSPAYNMPYALRLRGALDAAALGRSLTEIVRRHESLRTRFPAVDGRPVQRVDPAGPVRPALVDLGGLPPEERGSTLRELAAAEALRPFDLAAGPLLRSTLARLDEEDHAVLLTLHHVVSDGWSTGVLVRELSELYAACSEGCEPSLPELPVQYADYAAWQRAWLAGDVLEAQLAFWREKLKDAPPALELPTDRPRPSVPGDRAGRVDLRLAAETARALRALSREGGATLYMTLLAGLQLLLARWSGQDDVVVGTPVANRTRLETEGLIGFFANTLALRTDLSGDPTVRGLLGRVRREVLEAQAHQDLPFDRLVEELQPERSLQHSPLFQVLFVFHAGEPAPPAMGALAAEPLPLPPGAESARFDLQLTLAESGGEVKGALSYRAELWDAATAERMAGHLRLLLEGMAADPERRVSRLELLPPAERQRLEEWSHAAADYPAGRCVHELFAERAARTPDAPAVVHAGGTLTYGELDRGSSRLAHHLRGLGVRPDTRVGLCLERGPEMMVAVLGVLKAGGAYVPVDPAYPAERVAYMLADSAAPVLLTLRGLAGGLPASGARVVCLDADAGEIGLRSAEAPESGTLPDNLAYVVYTSGSTGRPKGVAMTHRPLVNLLAWQEREWKHPSAAATLQFTTLSFDVSFQEVFSCWLSGGRLVLVSEDERRDLAAVLDRLDGDGVERLFLPYVALQHLAELAVERGTAPRRLREVQTAGEQLRVTEPIRRLFTATGATLSNQYGPSETHVATAHVLEGPPGAWPLLPGIGRPVDNARCYVLDRGLEPAPVGVPGELYLGGVCLARGYLDRPELTADRFAPDPFGGPGARAYRTGDRARWLADGTLEFMGRLDDQVKVRGFRIEPAEVEAALEAHPGVREAAVVVREDAPGDRRLVGYVVPAPGARVLAAELRAHLGGRLPEHMVPGAFVVLEAFPLTPSGKVARRALPAPDAPGADLHAAPRTPAEEILAGIFAEVLKVEGVGARDDFFALGGHSLLATQVATRARAAFGTELPLRVLFREPTVAGLAAWLAARRSGAARDASPIERVAEPGAWLPLSFAQQRLWLVNQMDAESRVYNQLLGFRLTGRLDARALRRALAELVRRHAVFRTRFVDRDGVPGQVLDPPRGLPLPLVDLAGTAGREAALRGIVRERSRELFDLRSGNLLRVLLVRLAADEHALVATMHHITNDGWSAGIMFREVAELYRAYSGGGESPLPEPAVQYADYAVWQRAWLTAEREAEQLEFWRRQLDALPAMHLAADRARSADGTDGETQAFFLPAELSEGVRRLSRSLGATPFMTLLAAFQVLLHWQGRGDEVVVGTDVANRNLRSETEGLIGFFVNQLVLRTRMDGSPSFGELVARVREVTLAAYDHQDVPFDRVVEALRPRRAAGETPFFRVKFVLQNAPAAEFAELPGLLLEPLPTERSAAQLDVLLAMHDAGERMSGLFEYRTSLFSRELVGRWIRRFLAVLEAAAADPGTGLDELEARLDAEERSEGQGAREALREKRRARFAGR
ncbi:MAG: non-ribosomal peptide synthase/polyketide synthase [Gemmatimonadota bacterium]